MIQEMFEDYNFSVQIQKNIILQKNIIFQLSIRALLFTKKLNLFHCHAWADAWSLKI